MRAVLQVGDKAPSKIGDFYAGRTGGVLLRGALRSVGAASSGCSGYEVRDGGREVVRNRVEMGALAVQEQGGLLLLVS